MASSGKLHLTIKNRERIIFDGEVKSLTSYNEKGKFDVLPQHANFISLIRKELVYRELDGKENKLELTKGII
ncbi:MAG: hypothetical protein PVJ52_03685, partial [Candidatus Woesebacteria bacterium]